MGNPIGWNGCHQPSRAPFAKVVVLTLIAGLDMCEQFMDVSDVIRDEDLIMHKINCPGNGIGTQYFSAHPLRNIQQLVTSMVPTSRSRRPSARELNLLKRKAKNNSKDQPKGGRKMGIQKQCNHMIWCRQRAFLWTRQPHIRWIWPFL
ncbi:UNVERIFIED_CONTAM: TATA-binding protein-associated factor BTAF1 [Sesamum radiatum]|uniref:TATA-binding protein-associated factor BTAF1 n=1 Tax=Sesamum radiatum TaxID=300843 RepID=A0AAW2KZ77_SESRA